MGGELQPGQRVGNYVISRRIGQGGMGAVYLAEHPQIGRQVAIKVLAAHLGQQQGVAERFMAEARSVNRIAHPNIIEIYDFGQTEGGRLYFTMELLEGRELTALINERGAMPPSELLPYLQQICEALQAAHDKGVVHRDLKPENIYLLARGRPTVKVLDFGIAKLLEADPQGGAVARTSTGMIIGSPLTIAPEQAAGLPDQIGPHTDIYSLGVILYWMLAGQPPFVSQAPGMLIAQHITAAPPPLADSAPGLSPALVELVHQCLAKEPTARPASARGVAEAFAAAVMGLPTAAATVASDTALPPTRIQAGSPGPVTTLGSAAAEVVSSPAASVSVAATAPRSKLWIGVGLGAAVVVIAGMVVVGWLSREPAEGPLTLAAALPAKAAAAPVKAKERPSPVSAPERAAEPPRAPEPPAAGGNATPAVKLTPGSFRAKPTQPPPPKLSSTAVSPSAAGLQVRYRARLSARDHLNSRGQPLGSAAKIIRQDRANYHRFGVRDPEDQGDLLYHRKGARNDLERRVRGALSPYEQRAILVGTPVIEVMVSTRFTTVRVLSSPGPAMRTR